MGVSLLLGMSNVGEKMLSVLPGPPLGPQSGSFLSIERAVSPTLGLIKKKKKTLVSSFNNYANICPRPTHNLTLTLKSKRLKIPPTGTLGKP